MRIEEEKKVATKMIEIYCKHYENNSNLCENCKDLIAYAHLRLDKCRWQNNKPTCRKCTSHCYSPKYKEKMKQVMRYAGPRMIYYAPLKALYHIMQELK